LDQSRKIRGIMFKGSHPLARPWTTRCVKEAARAYQTGWQRNWLCWRITSLDSQTKTVHLSLTESDQFSIIDPELLELLAQVFPVKSQPRQEEGYQ